MLTRRTGLLVALVALVVLAAGGLVVLTDAVRDTERADLSGRSAGQCRGLTHRQVRGSDPTYTPRSLSRFPGSEQLCRGVWLPRPRRNFVPQGLVLDGSTAWVSGFRHRQGYGERPCRLVRLSLLTGRRLAHHSSIEGRVGQRPRTYCRHGGGLARHGRLLWVAESSKLWLVDPARKGSPLEARRAWRIEAPVRGSAIVATRNRVGLVPFQTRGVAHIYWYDISQLTRRGVKDLAVLSAGRGQLGAVRRTLVPRLVQGATLDRSGRLYLSRSNLACGEVVTPRGRRIAFVPGAEGIAFSARGHRLWAVSESGSRPYSRLGKPMTPGVVSYEWPRLLDGARAGCLPAH